MRIAIVCDVLGEENNGTTVTAMNLIRFLKERGHEVRVVCPDEDKRNLPGYYIVPQLNVGPLNSYVQKNGVSIAVSDKAVLDTALGGVDIIHIMTPFFLGKAAVDYAKAHGIPVTAGFHAQAENITSHLHLMNSRLVNDLTYKAMYRLVFQYVDAIHYPSRFIRGVFEGEVGPTNGYVISNGVNSRFVKTPARRPESWNGLFVILFTGRFGREKSHKVLIDAVSLSAHADRIQLVFAGEGPLHDELAEYGKKLKHPPVMQFFTRDEMLSVINSADLYVHPAEIEIEAIACLEAISCGLVPVIADSPRSATRFFALGDRNLFHYNDPDDLKAKIDYWIEHPQEKEACSLEYQGYTRRFEQRHCMEQMEQMLLETIERHAQAVKQREAASPADMHRAMRRRDRELHSTDEMFDILNRCDTVRIGIQGERYPYVVPVSFGAEMISGKPVIYFHCARQGLKLDLIARNPDVCVEGDIFIKTETTDHGITTRYESVIGFGRCELLTDQDEIVHGLRVLTEHYGYMDYPLTSCRALQYLYVGRIVLDELTGKRNLPAAGAGA